MKRLTSILLVAMLGIIISTAAMPESKASAGYVYIKSGNHYVEYVGCTTGPAFCMRKTGYCALSSGGAMRYLCGE